MIPRNIEEAAPLAYMPDGAASLSVQERLD